MPGLLDGLLQEGGTEFALLPCLLHGLLKERCPALGVGQGGAGQGPVGRDRRDEVAVEGLLVRQPGGGPVQGCPFRRLTPDGCGQPVEDPCSHVASWTQGG